MAAELVPMGAMMAPHGNDLGGSTDTYPNASIQRCGTFTLARLHREDGALRP